MATTTEGGGGRACGCTPGRLQVVDLFTGAADGATRLRALLALDAHTRRRVVSDTGRPRTAYRASLRSAFLPSRARRRENLSHRPMLCRRGHLSHLSHLSHLLAYGRWHVPQWIGGHIAFEVALRLERV